MSLFTRPERRDITFDQVWGADVVLDDIRANFETLIPVFGAVRLLCTEIAKTPLHAYAADGSGRLERQPAFLHKPSQAPRATPFSWKYRMAYSALVRGGATGVISGIGPDGWPTSVEWLDPTRVHVLDDDDVLHPTFLWDGEPIRDQSAVIHVPAFPLTGKVLGISPIKAFALTSEVGWQALRFGRDWFRNNGIPGATMKHQKIDTFSDEDTARLKKAYKAAVTGRDLLLLGRDWDFNAVSIPADESQFLATIRATANQIGAIYGVPPERIGGEAPSSRSYANLDMDLRYVQETSVAGWLVNFEQALTTLAPHREGPSDPEPTQFLQFNLDANVRADLLTRMQAHEIALRTGLETQDEGRAVEDKPPLTAAERSEWMSTYRQTAKTQETR